MQWTLAICAVVLTGWSVKYRLGMKNLQLSTNIWLHLRNDIIHAHSYYGTLTTLMEINVLSLDLSNGVTADDLDRILKVSSRQAKASSLSGAYCYIMKDDKIDKNT